MERDATFGGKHDALSNGALDGDGLPYPSRGDFNDLAVVMIAMRGMKEQIFDGEKLKFFQAFGGSGADEG